MAMYSCKLSSFYVHLFVKFVLLKFLGQERELLNDSRLQDLGYSGTRPSY